MSSFSHDHNYAARQRMATPSTSTGGGGGEGPYLPFTTPFRSTPSFLAPPSTNARGQLSIVSSVRRPPLVTPSRSKGTTTTTPRSVARGLVESVDEDCVVAVVEGRGQARGEIGIAYINTRTAHVILCQFPDTQTYHRVITKLNILRPHKILMPTTCCDRTGTASALYMQLKADAVDVEIVPTLRRHFSEGTGLQRIKDLTVTRFSSVIQVVSQRYYCLAAVAALLKYVEVTYSLLFTPKSLKVEFHGSENTCMIDSKTAQHLELLQNNFTPSSDHSLLGILSNCRTPGGTRLLRMNILQPPCDLKLIQERLDCIGELLESHEVLGGLQDVLSRIPIDIEHVISTLIQIPHQLNDRMVQQRINFVIALKHTLGLLPTIVQLLQDTQHDFFQTIRGDFKCPAFQSMFDQIQNIIQEEAQVQKGQNNMKRQRCFAVKPGVNQLLDIARQAYCEIVEEMNDYVCTLGHQYKMALRLGENIKRGHYLQLILPGRGDKIEIPELPNIFLQVSRFRNVLNFTTETLLAYGHRLREVEKEVEHMTATIINELLDEIRGEISNLYGVSEGIARLDILYALSNYALGTVRCVRPRFSRSGTSITNGRHPILELIKSQSAVPNNTFLTEDVNFSLITGPNMSGKTTYLKQVASLQILAQIGSYVPADAATFRIASNIFSRIGTGDNIESSASSFEVEMTEMKYILDNINDNSVVIIDELGRCTSVEEGTALSWAIAEELMKKKSFILFATHYHFLTKLEAMYLNVMNYTMEAQEWMKKPDPPPTLDSSQEDPANEENPLDKFKLKYTHVVKPGVTEIEHYGLKLAGCTSLPPEVGKRALLIAQKIIENRHKGPAAFEHWKSSNAMGRNRALFLLGCQLKLASEMYDSTPESEMKEYLTTLHKEFITTFGTESASVAQSDRTRGDVSILDDTQLSSDHNEEGESERESSGGERECFSQESGTIVEEHEGESEDLDESIISAVSVEMSGSS